MKKIILSALMLAVTLTLSAQNRTLKKVIEFSMPGENGSNGAAVVYHPLQKKYYAAMAGNADYPLSAFDLKGTLLTNEDITTGFDVRGMWYNSKTKTIQANGYNDFGWTNFKLDAKGSPTGNEVFVEGLKQPTEQSVGTFNDKQQKVYFLKDISIVQYDLKGNEEKTFPLNPKIVADDAMGEGLPSDYNGTAIYTGIVKGEIGLLNNTDKTIELYNLATGKPTFKWKLPEDVPDNSLFNFAYSNGIVWLFDKDLRTWFGYK
jgi:hypothetical protein